MIRSAHPNSPRRPETQSGTPGRHQRRGQRRDQRRLSWRSAAVLALLTGSVQAAQAQQTYDLRTWFDDLPAGAAYPTQTDGDTWTFRVGSASGSLLPAYGRDYYNYPGVLYQQIGIVVDTGTFGCSPGYCPPGNAASTLATFNGVFVHPGPASATVAVFQADQAVVIDEVALFSEGVANASNGNGMTVTVIATIGGVDSAVGNFDFSWASTLAAADERHFMPGLTLQAGDRLSIAYGNNGGYLFDHANVNAVIYTSAVAVPEPSTWALWLVGLTGASVLARRRRPA